MNLEIGPNHKSISLLFVWFFLYVLCICFLQLIIQFTFFLVNGVVMQGDGKQFEFDPNLPK